MLIVAATSVGLELKTKKQEYKLERILDTYGGSSRKGWLLPSNHHLVSGTSQY